MTCHCLLLLQVLNTNVSTDIVSQGMLGCVADKALLHNSKGVSIICCKPVTGRTHQIRLHLAHAGYPILGDEVYGMEGAWINRQALHAWCLTLQGIEGQMEQTQFTAAPPEDMLSAAASLGLSVPLHTQTVG